MKHGASDSIGIRRGPPGELVPRHGRRVCSGKPAADCRLPFRATAKYEAARRDGQRRRVAHSGKRHRGATARREGLDGESAGYGLRSRPPTYARLYVYEGMPPLSKKLARDAFVASAG